MKNFSELTEQELLALAVSLEEEDIRSYGDLAEFLHDTHPGTAKLFASMAERRTSIVTACSLSIGRNLASTSH